MVRQPVHFGEGEPEGLLARPLPVRVIVSILLAQDTGKIPRRIVQRLRVRPVSRPRLRVPLRPLGCGNSPVDALTGEDSTGRNLDATEYPRHCLIPSCRMNVSHSPAMRR